MFHVFRATRLFKCSLSNLPCKPSATCRLLGSSLNWQSVASRREYTDIVSPGQASHASPITSGYHSGYEIDTDILKRLSASSILTLVLTKSTEAQERANLDVSLDIYLHARKIFRPEVLYQVKEYLCNQLTKPTLSTRDEKDRSVESYEELKKRFPWPNTSPGLREAFHNDIGSKNVPAQKQQAYLKLYDANNQDPEPFLRYCDRIAARSERAKGSRSQKSFLVSAMSKECRDAGMILRHRGLHGDAAWLAKFSAYNDHKYSPRWSIKSIEPRYESREYLSKIYKRMKIDNHWN